MGPVRKGSPFVRYLHLTARPSDKGNASVGLDTADYNLKIAALLKDQVHRKLNKDYIEAVAYKVVCRKIFHMTGLLRGFTGFRRSTRWGFPKFPL
jgi:hypothetical protein